MEHTSAIPKNRYDRYFQEPKMFKANRSTKGPNMPNMQDVFFCRVPELKPDLHPRHKNAGFEPCTFSLLSRQHSNPNDLHANPHTHNASCHHHLGAFDNPRCISCAHLKKMRCRQRLREHTKQSAHRR